MSGYTTVFDELLERNRARLGGRLGTSPSTIPSGSYPDHVFPESTPPTPTVESRSPGRTASTRLPAKTTTHPAAPSGKGGGRKGKKTKRSKAMQRLTERFGDDWSYEIVERRREGNEVIVLCKVNLTDGNVQKSQFGRGKIRGPSDTIQGSAAGVPIAIRIPQPDLSTTDPEEGAYRAAVNDALGKCADLL